MSFLDERFTDEYDDNPKLKGKQKDLPDSLQKAIINKEDVEEGKLSKALGGVAVLATLLGINKAASEKIYNSDPKIKALTSQYEKAKEDGDKEAMAKFEKEIERRKVMWDTGKVDESATLFEIDLKSLLEKHGKEGTVKITKAIMDKLHDKGKATVDGTKLVFKEVHNGAGQEYLVSYQVGSWGVSRNERVKASSPEEAIAIVTRKVKNDGDYITPNNWSGDPVISAKPITNEDTQLALPEPDAPDFLGDDGIDYEGGMAKSQMFKMKKYADALCDMIDDESQLEAWVQAKLTKASDYMSAVYHYLDYQNSKLNENRNQFDGVDVEWEDIDADIENRPDYQEGTLYGYTLDGREVQAHGSYSEFDGYQVIGDIELA